MKEISKLSLAGGYHSDLNLIRASALASLLLVICLLFFALPATRFSNAQQTGTVVAVGSASVQVTAIVMPSYGLDDSNVPFEVNATINLYLLNLTTPEQIQLISSFSASDFTGQAVLENGSVVTLQASALSATRSAFTGYYITLPISTSNVSVIMSGISYGEAFMYRFITPIPFVLLEGTNLPESYSIDLVTNSHTTLSQAYYYQGAQYLNSPTR